MSITIRPAVAGDGASPIGNDGDSGDVDDAVSDPRQQPITAQDGAAVSGTIVPRRRDD